MARFAEAIPEGMTLHMKKTAIVTGASRGIGFAIARRLGLEGYNVALMARGDMETCQENLNLLDADGTSWLYVQGNIASTQNRERLVAETVARFGGVHVLVNNAGVAPDKRADLLDMTEESFDHVVGINTKGAFFLSQLVAKQMLTQDYAGAKRSTIINISSCSADVSSINRGEYCISKAGMGMVTKLFADRLAGAGIYVHEIRPGVIDTDMTSAVREKYDNLIEAGAFPLPRWGTTEDVAAAVSAFCGDCFLYTTGNYIDVDGGFHIKRL